jgi:sarcosine oxidase subunit beta
LVRLTAGTADVAIVGAGIMGVSTAYHLARRGVGRVVVLERDSVCSGSTALASGGIRHQYANRLGVELTTHSIVTYEDAIEHEGLEVHVEIEPPPNRWITVRVSVRPPRIPPVRAVRT